jgi:hypothetical protein
VERAPVGRASPSVSQVADGTSGSETVYCSRGKTVREVDRMKVSNGPFPFAALGLVPLFLCLSGCFVHTREVVHHDDTAYAEGYKEGYYDREHNRWWHDNAWHDCDVNDIHCPR